MVLLGSTRFLLEGLSAHDFDIRANVESKKVGPRLFCAEHFRGHNPLLHSDVRNPPDVSFGSFICPKEADCRDGVTNWPNVHHDSFCRRVF